MQLEEYKCYAHSKHHHYSFLKGNSGASPLKHTWTEMKVTNSTVTVDLKIKTPIPLGTGWEWQGETACGGPTGTWHILPSFSSSKSLSLQLMIGKISNGMYEGTASTLGDTVTFPETSWSQRWWCIASISALSRLRYCEFKDASLSNVVSLRLAWDTHPTFI